MRKSQKLMITSIMVAVIAMVTVGPTMSWLSATTDPVVNTFAGGAIALQLDESQVDANGKKMADAPRVKENRYKYMAGAEMDKDPTVTVLKGSEECYVFLLVENELNEKFSINYDTDSWLKFAEADSKTIYAYKETVDAYKSEKDMELPPIFTQIDISSDLSETDITELGERKLSVTAFAVQASNMDANTACSLAAEQFGMAQASVSVPDIQ